MWNFRVTLIFAWLLGVTVHLCAVDSTSKSVWMGMTSGQLIERIGEPASKVRTTQKEILLYADGSRFEFKDDQLVLVRGFKGPTALSEHEAPTVAHGRAAQYQEPGLVEAAPVVAPDLPKAAPQEVANVVKALGDPGVPTYANVLARAMPALQRAAAFFESVFDPQLFDSHQRLWPRPTLLVAALFRLGLTMFAVRFAVQRLGRSLSWFDYFFLSSVELISRVAISSALVLLMKISISFVVLELVTTAALVVAAVTRPEIHSLRLALRVVLMAKVITFAITFVCFISLVDIAH